MLGWKCIATTPLIFWFPTKVEECTKTLSRLLLYPGFSGKTGSRIRNFFGLRPSRDQDEANYKKFSQIGPAVLEEIGRNHTHKQTSCCYIIEITHVNTFEQLNKHRIEQEYILYTPREIRDWLKNKLQEQLNTDHQIIIIWRQMFRAWRKRNENSLNKWTDGWSYLLYSCWLVGK